MEFATPAEPGIVDQVVDRHTCFFDSGMDARGCRSVRQILRQDHAVRAQVVPQGFKTIPPTRTKDETAPMRGMNARNRSDPGRCSTSAVYGASMGGQPVDVRRIGLR